MAIEQDPPEVGDMSADSEPVFQPNEYSDVLSADIVDYLYAYHVNHVAGYPEVVRRYRDELSTRTLIDTTTGILMQRHNLDAAGAERIMDELIARIVRAGDATPTPGPA